MVQTNFTVANAGSLTAVLAEIGSGGIDAAIGTAYNVTVTAGVSLSAGVTLDAGSSLTLHGSYPFIVPAFAVTGTVIADLNFTGTVTLDNGVLTNPALSINSGGTVVQGLFTGTVLGTAADAGDQAINSGTIAASGTYAAIELDSGTVQNGWNGPLSALVSGVAGGVQLNSDGLVQNGGSIVASGTSSIAVYIGSLGGTVFNGQISDTSALISGAQNGVAITGAGAVSNDGTIAGVASDAVYLASGMVTNGQIGVTSALIDGGAGGNGVWVGAGLGTVTNFGSIIGGGASGVYLEAGGTVTNGASADPAALISGAADGVFLLTQGTLLNYGTVQASGAAQPNMIGALFDAGGTIQNLATQALISGPNWGVAVEGGAGSVTNLGTIDATAAKSIGVDLGTGGTVVNAATIAGAYYGVRILPGAAGAGASVVNTGTVEGQTAVDFRHGGIQAAGTLTNDGLIESTSGTSGNAVVFGAGNERLVLQSGGTVVGQVIGNNAAGSSTTLELAAGTEGTLSGLRNDAGTVADSAGSFQFSSIGTIDLDAGASWTVATPGTFDTLANAGGLTIAGGPVTVSGSLANSGSISIASGTLTASLGVLADPGIITVGTAGLLKVTGSGIAAAGTADIQIGGGAAAALDVTGTGAVVNTGSYALGIGSSGVGSALISQGGSVLASTGFAADEAVYTGGSVGSTGQLTVTDPGSELLATGQFSVGLGGTGSLLIENQATVATGGNSVDRTEGLDVGQLATASGEVTVTGTRSLLSNTGRFVVGDAGVGSLSIEAGGTVVTSSGTVAGLAGAVIANTASASGSSVDVSGTGSNWQVGGSLIVGDAGFGELSLAQGGSVAATGADLGAAAGGDGVVSVVGTHSALSLSGDFTVGDRSTGELTILGGANVSGHNLTVGGTGASSASSVDMEGNGSQLALTGDLDIGVNNQGIFSFGAGTTLTVAGTIFNGPNGVENLLGFLDPAYLINDNTGSLGSVEYVDVAVENSGQYSIIDNSVTIDTPLVTYDPNDADSSNGEFVIGNAGTLVLNASTVDNSQLIKFGAGNAVLAIGQQPQVDNLGSITGTVPAGSPNVLPNFQAVLQNFKAGDRIEVPGLAYASATESGGAVTLWSGAGGTGTDLGSLDFITATGAADSKGATAAAAQFTSQTLCFLAGTLLATPSGQRAVERLKVGDLVLTATGQARPVVWLGVGRVLATRGRRNAATPVIVSKGALGPNVPHDDLRVTKGHSLLLDGVLIPVEFLVNHRSIRWDDRAQEVSVHHVELETHDVLLANSAPAESYRDDGNRWLFQNANAGWDQPPKPPCKPVLTGGPVVDRVWRRLLDACGPRPDMPLTEEPDLHLLVDGARVEAAVPVRGVYVFDLGGTPDEARIVSRAAVPQELGLVRDSRCLGVAVRRIAVRQGSRFRVLLAGDARLADGFHRFEADTGLHWTNGDAAVPGGLFAGFSGRRELMVHAAAATRYVEDGAATRCVEGNVPASGRRAAASAGTAS